ncbi:hypothetical protein AB0A71_28370 [Kitasatospora aureofaciens]|uniref:hypothetical protein n=1 Tax=Kitasatospora aureofaciens TaxID=1894 RepID=UPI0033EF8639
MTDARLNNEGAIQVTRSDIRFDSAGIEIAAHVYTPSLNILWHCSIPAAAAQLARSVSSYAAPPQLQ